MQPYQVMRLRNNPTGGNAWEAAVAALSPVMWLRLSEPSGAFVDASGNGNNGADNNGVARSQSALWGNTGLSAGFAATNKSVTVTDAAALKPTGDLTVLFGLKRFGGQGAGFPKLFWKPTDYANGRCNYGFQYLAAPGNNKVLFRVNAAGAYYDATCVTTIADDIPYMLVGRRSGTEVSIWINGVKEHTAALPSSGTALDTSTDPIWIGGQTNNANDQYTGSLDEPMVFNYALSDAQIIALYNARQSPVDDPLAATIIAHAPWAYYKLGEPNGSTTYLDSSSNMRHLSTTAGTVTGGVTGVVDEGTAVDFTTGYISSSNNQYGAAQQTTFHGDKAISYCVVTEFDSVASCVPIHLGNASQTGSQGVFLQLLATGALRFQMWDTTGGAYKNFDTAAGVVSAGVPYIIHVRRAVGGAAAIFVNGSSVATSALMTGTIGMSQTASSGGQRIMLGALNASAPSSHINGRLQHCAVFASSLSDAEIAAQYAASGL